MFYSSAMFKIDSLKEIAQLDSHDQQNSAFVLLIDLLCVTRLEETDTDMHVKFVGHVRNSVRIPITLEHCFALGWFIRALTWKEKN